MKKPTNYDNVESVGYGSERKRLVPGGYVIRIESVEDVEDREYIKMEYEIAEGEFKDYAAGVMERAGFNPLKFVRSYKDSAAGMFKGFLTALESENPGFVWNWDAKSVANLRGKVLGAILREEEYAKTNGEIGTRFSVFRIIPVADVRSGNFRVPDTKKLPVENPTNAFAPYEADDTPLPF